MEVLRPDLTQLCLAALGRDDAIFVRHPQRDDIYDEAALSIHMGKYAGMPLLEQVNAYRRAGHPEHWGLMHAGMLVRRNNARMRAVNEAWWDEIVRWSVQDQLSLPPLLRTMPLEYRWFDVAPLDMTPHGLAPGMGWVRWGTHVEPDVLVPMAPRQAKESAYHV
jgi:hypothetical protein